MADVGVILPSRKGPTFGGVEVTGIIRHRIRRSAKISEHPIENGSVLADHRQREPVVIELEQCIISDVLQVDVTSQVGFVGDANPEVDDSGQSMRARQAFLALLDFDARNLPFEFVSGTEMFADMLFESIVQSKEAANGGAYVFDATLRQAQFGATRTVEVAPALADRKVSPPEDKGNVAPQEPSAEPDDPASTPYNIGGDGKLLNLLQDPNAVIAPAFNKFFEQIFGL